MKYYCNKCNKLVGDITGMIRKGTIMICAICYDADDQIKTADKFANAAKDNSMPPFMKEFFGAKNGFNTKRQF